jgi:hypothetical protein
MAGDDVTQFYVCKIQNLEDDSFGEGALQSSELLQAQISKKKLLPETGLIGPV